MPEMFDTVSPISRVLMRPLLEALDVLDTAILRPIGSLPAPSFWAERHRIVVCATSINALPMFRSTMVAVAASNNMDVILVRHGAHPEIIDEVSIDLVLGRGRETQMLWSMARFRADNGDTWLVPSGDGRGPFLRVDPAGLTKMSKPPYDDMDARSDGLCRAARETVLTLRALRSRC